MSAILDLITLANIVPGAGDGALGGGVDVMEKSNASNPDPVGKWQYISLISF